MFKTTKYEIIHVSPGYWSVLEHYTFLGFEFSSYFKDFHGFRHTFSTLLSAEKWIEDAIRYDKHIVTTVKTYEVEYDNN